VSTWIGALVETRGRRDLAEVAAKHGIVVTRAEGPWLLVEGEVALGSLGLPAFAQELSRDLGASVIAFAIQTTASVEELEQWTDGQRVRRLAYSGDAGGWEPPQGTPQPWEPAFFFAEEESTAVGATWPGNLTDELSGDDIARYERARDGRDAAPVLDLLSGGSVWPLRRLCAHLGVDPDAPGGRYSPPKNRRGLLVVVAIAVFLVGMVLLGFLSARR
jgi:hypothetical protein